MSHIEEGIKPSRLLKKQPTLKHQAKKLIEYSRYYSGVSNKKFREKGNIKKQQHEKKLDSYPSKESIRAKRAYIMTNDKRKPLIHFLEAHEGEVWNEVFSKIKQQLSPNSVIWMKIEEELAYLVRTNAYLENGKIVLISQWGKPIALSKHPWFYVHPESGRLKSNRNKKQKGPYPKKARWKKQKQKEKIKRRLGIVSKPNHTYAIKKVQTYQQQLILNQVYDLKIYSHLLKGFYKCRVRLTSITTSSYGLSIEVVILKSNNKAFLRDMKIRLYENDFYYSHQYLVRIPPTAFSEWTIVDVGNFNF